MKNLFKQIISFILPVTVLVLVPLWVEKKRTIEAGPHLVFGLILILFGLIVMALTITSFIRIGKGTLAPWSPTKKLVITGLYRYVRNPMILGVFIVLLGEALSLWSKNILIWAGCFFIINTIYFIISEEPGLEKRFGDEYNEYKKHVSRWLPRLTPYHPDQNKNQ
ncbi:MAG TPA: isoprenylcysteine carboxylmethyltransferase family protein [Chitinophagaceae bacterium]|jgi:protein-S-isoprenylcysteine O-methyltransferase Ste14|nr:isoprenylcysteine carboxylmethyltransferase family protein [Chitinophagaceae bacterium]